MKITVFSKFASSLGVSENNLLVILVILLGAIIFVIVLLLKSKKNKNKEEEVISFIPKSPNTRLKARHFNRVPVSINTTFTIADESDQKTCKIIDISLSGLRFICQYDISKRTKVRFTIPNINENIKIKDFILPGEIVRNTRLNQSSFEYGVEFLHILKNNMELLELIVNNPDKLKNTGDFKKI